MNESLERFLIKPSASSLLKPLLDYELTPFGELRVQDGERMLTLYDTWTPAVNEFMQEQGIRWLQVSYVGMKGTWKGKDLEFLRQMPFLEGLSLIHREPILLDPIHALGNLKRLVLAISCDCPVDFTAFPKLEIAEFPWIPKRDSFSKAAKLRRLVIEAYKRKNAEALRNLNELEHLDLYSSPIEDIAGIGALSTLRRLRLAHCRCLAEISPIGKLKGLKRIELQNLPKVTNLEVLGQCLGLEDVEILDWKSQLDIGFVSRLPKLKALVIDTTVTSLKALAHHPQLERVMVMRAADNDSAPLLTLLRLKKVYFHSKWRANHPKETFSTRGFWIQQHIRE